MDMSEDELNELRLKAEIIAEATGRTTEAVLEDLLDDGLVNLSNEDKNDKDLEAQLKEAAELIATVQNISAEVSANTVLNGGDNSTEVKVETTLEGDIVDRALESVQRKAEKLKMIIAIVAPILLLLSGGVGLDYFMDNNDSSESSDDIYIDEIWGCTIMDAENYDSIATNDDGSCYWDDNNGGGGGPPDCSENWRWENVVIRDFDSNGEGYNDDIEIRTVFEDMSGCNRHMEGYFIIAIWDEDNGQDYTQHTINDKFHDRFVIDHHEYDLPESNYVISINYEFNEDFWEGPSALVTTEAPDPDDEIGCDAYFINSQAYLEDSDSEQDAVTMSADVAIVLEEDNCKDRNFEIIWQLYEHNNPDVVKYEHTTWESGESSDPDGADYVFHTWDNVDEGTYDPKVSLFLDGDQLDEKWIAHIISIEDETSEPETCQINLYGIVFLVNETNTASIDYDLDCGYGETNETIGYNVSTQLIVYPAGSVDEYLKLDSGLHFISGYAEDIHTLIIDNFTDANTTHYDFYWYAIWTNDSGGYEMIERTWLNQEVTHPSEPEEPVDCSNLNITSNSLDLSKDSNDDLVASWNLSHDGPDLPDCFVEVEVMITIYQNGQYYNVSDFSQNGLWKVYTNSEGNQTLQITSDDCQLFKDLPPGTYEVLMKYRIVGESETSEDHFANSVVIS